MHIRTICTALSAVVVIVAIISTVAILAGRVSNIAVYAQSIAVDDLGLTSRLILVATGLATAAVLFKAICHLRRLLGNYSRREIFTQDSARQIRQFGVCCVLWGLVKMVWAYLPLIVSHHPPQAIGLSADSMIIGAVIIWISWFAEMAAALREENDLTI